jgi:hypothetical protein
MRMCQLPDHAPGRGDEIRVRAGAQHEHRLLGAQEDAQGVRERTVVVERAHPGERRDAPVEAGAALTWDRSAGSPPRMSIVRTAKIDVSRAAR